ncbi:MAG: hypothetical protein INF12_14715 [Methylobacterium sp.]|nr:hypothetical protein [Methylobacterium sp.]
MPRLPLIASAVAAEARISPAELAGKSRAKPLVRARHLAWLIASELTGMTLNQIGRGFGGRDHTTIMHGICRARELKATDPAFRALHGAATRRALASMRAPEAPETESERIIAALMVRYRAKLRIMAQARPEVFIKRFGDTVTV